MNTTNAKKEKVFSMIKTIIVELHQNVLGTKIYWENKEEKKIQTEFWKKYQEATTDAERDIQIAIKELKELGLNPIFGYAKTKVNGMRYTRYVEAV